MESIRLVARNGEAVRQAFERGEVLRLDTANEEMTDEFLLFAIESGLLEQWADGFPDPRNWSEIGCQVILAAEVAARFVSIYSQRKTGYVLRSARVLGALGYSLEVLEEGDGLSGRGTIEDQLYSQDVLRKLLGKAEKQVRVTEEDQAAAVAGGAAVKVRDRASRRAVKEPELDEADAAARSHAVAGGHFAGKTRQAIAFEQLKTRRTNVIVYAGGYFEIFETLSFVHLVLNLSPGVQARLKHWLEEYLPQLAKRE